MSKNIKFRLDQLLVEKKLVDTKTKAQSMIMAGQVKVNDKVITKSGNGFPLDSNIVINKLGPDWVSRGALKLLRAIEIFKIEISNKVCLDIGSSTGGFSDVLLSKKAKTIFAVDVGTNQLHEKLRKEKDIISIENFNARYLNSTVITKKIDILVCDVSFISLKKVIFPSIKLLSKNAEIIALIKPQFETHKKNLRKGVVRDSLVHDQICNDIRNWFSNICKANVIGIIPSPIAGPKGNLEFLIYCRLGIS